MIKSILFCNYLSHQRQYLPQMVDLGTRYVKDEKVSWNGYKVVRMVVCWVLITLIKFISELSTQFHTAWSWLKHFMQWNIKCKVKNQCRKFVKNPSVCSGCVYLLCSGLPDSLWLCRRKAYHSRQLQASPSSHCPHYWHDGFCPSNQQPTHYTG